MGLSSVNDAAQSDLVVLLINTAKFWLRGVNNATEIRLSCVLGTAKSWLTRTL
jgi:hypothetical protein